MNIQELTRLLNGVAEKDLAIGADIDDHPCSVAIRAINEMNADVTVLIGVLNDNKICSGYSKRVQTLIKINYDPEF